MGFKSSIRRSLIVTILALVMVGYSSWSIFVGVSEQNELSYSYLSLILFIPVGVMSISEIGKSLKAIQESKR